MRRRLCVAMIALLSLVFWIPGTAAAADNPAPPAPPSSPPPTQKTSPPVLKHVYKDRNGQVKVGICKPDFQYPHKSTHDPTTVNVVAVVTCDQKVPYLSVRVSIYDETSLLKVSSDSPQYDVTRAQNNVAVPCINGQYSSWRGFAVTFDDGVTATWPQPVEPVENGYGPWNGVNNC